MQLKNKELSENHIIELKRSEAHSSAMLTHTCKKLALNLVVLSSTILLFIFKHFIIASISLTLASNPVVPFIFAILALALSITNHCFSQHIDKDKPKINARYLSGKSFMFFKPDYSELIDIECSFKNAS